MYVSLHGKQILTFSQAIKQSMKQDFQESMESGTGSYEQIKSIAHAYASKRGCSLQKAIYQVMSELLLWKIFPGVLFANINIPEKCIIIVKRNYPNYLKAVQIFIKETW